MKINKNLMRNRAGVFYDIKGEKIVAQFENKIDTFDLSVIEDGDVIEDIESELEFNPILDVKRIDGELEVTLRYFYNGDGEEWQK